MSESSLIAARYRVVRELGRGGMAGVYEVLDTVEGRVVALKRLEVSQDASTYRRAAHLFEAEFVTLSRLGHPRIVAVYDYGHDGKRPFYTQELLTGGDLYQACPVPWDRVCRLLIDVCSALSLLHSRHQVHRDVTPRNIRCTADDRAKLLDFGALAAFGVSKQAVGTPPFVSPEVLGSQSLDGRADLFGLGATAYYALTGKHAYPARTLKDLRDVWRSEPAPPSRWAPQVPKALDALVLSLLQLAQVARPATAAEVIERLSAIAGTTLAEQQVVQQAYLSQPNLCARQDAQLLVRQAAQRARRGRGRSLLVAGNPGTGRTRFLDTCALEAKLAGMRVVRADAGDAGLGVWGAACSIAAQLMTAYPEDAVSTLGERGSLLVDLLPAADPAVHAKVAGQNDQTPQASRVARLAAFRQWLVELSRQVPLMVVVDDLARLDDASAALVASLAQMASGEALVVVATGDRGDRGLAEGPVGLVAQAGSTIILRDLTQPQTESLLASVFGDVPNLRLLSARLFEVAHGNPKATMGLAQHLLDQGQLRYEAGAWTLPEKLDRGRLPSTAAELVMPRLRALPAGARNLAEAVALASCDALTYEDCKLLALHSSDQALLSDLASLTELGLLTPAGDHYGFADPTVRDALVSEVEPGRARRLHRVLISIFEAHYNDRFRVATHALRAGDGAKAIESILQYAQIVETQRSDPLAAFERVRSLPADRLQTTLQLQRIAMQDGGTRHVAYQMNLCLLSDGVLSGESPVEALQAVLCQLHHDAGLDLYEQDCGEDEPAVKLKNALQAAQVRFDSATPGDRVAPPGVAIRRLAQVIVSAIGIAVRGCDYALLAGAPRLGPLASLAHPLQLIDMNQAACMHVLAGRPAQARAIYADVLERMQAADRAGEDQSALLYMRLAIQHALGTFDINAGIASGVDRADQIEHNPSFAVNAYKLRMLNCQWQGDWKGAEKLRVQLELFRVQNRPPQIFEGTHLFPELLAYMAAQDLVRVKQAIPAIEAMADVLPTWQPIAALGRAAYSALRGDPASALVEAEAGLCRCAPGQHMGWVALNGVRLEALVGLERYAEAVDEGRRALAQVAQHGLSYTSHPIEQALAMGCAALGKFEEAVKLADASVRRMRERGTTGLLLGSAYETRARVALQMGHDDGFAEYSSLCGQQYGTGRNPVLSAKYERLMQFARQAHRDVSDELAAAADFTAQSAADSSSMAGTLLSRCQGASQRAQGALAAIVERACGEAGFLYLLQDSGPTFSASFGHVVPPAELDACVAKFIAAELGTGEQVTVTVDVEALHNAELQWPKCDGEPLVPLLLWHPDQDVSVLTGVVVVVPRPESRVQRGDPLLSALSRALYDAGDAVTALAG